MSGGVDDQGALFMQLGFNYGQKVLQEGEKGASKYLPRFDAFREHFRVDNIYVRRKLWLILLPFHRQFTSSRLCISEEDTTNTSSM